VFRNYFEGTSRTSSASFDSSDSCYYGTMFIGLVLHEGTYFFGTPGTIHGDDKKVQYPLINTDFLQGEEEIELPMESYIDENINLFLHRKIYEKYNFIKIYMFISPSGEKNFKWVIEYDRSVDKKGIEITHEEAFEVTSELTREFIIELFSWPEFNDTIYPIITTSGKSGCRKKKCGPWMDK